LPLRASDLSRKGAGAGRDRADAFRELPSREGAHAARRCAARPQRAETFVKKRAAGGRPLPRDRAYCLQIFQITPVPGICTSGASAGLTNLVSELPFPKSRTAP